MMIMQVDYMMDGIAILLVLISFLFIGVNQIMWGLTIASAFTISAFATILWWRRIKATHYTQNK